MVSPWRQRAGRSPGLGLWWTVESRRLESKNILGLEIGCYKNVKWRYWIEDSQRTTCKGFWRKCLGSATQAFLLCVLCYSFAYNLHTMLTASNFCNYNLSWMHWRWNQIALDSNLGFLLTTIMCRKSVHNWQIPFSLQPDTLARNNSTYLKDWGIFNDMKNVKDLAP